MRQSLWPVAFGGLGLGGLTMLGGTVLGGNLGSVAAGYGFLIALAALYMVAGLAVRERAWRRFSRPLPTANPDRLAGRRVF